jgi:putative transposase
LPRQARQAVADIPWHIIQRGHDRHACFFADGDYQFYLRHLKEQASQHGCSIHAYVLMTNHVHMLVTPDTRDGVSLMMKNLSQRYVQYINRTYERRGTLWEGRFRSCLTLSDSYALACHRYIELNPVRANMVELPIDYRWSSYSANAEGRANSLVTPHSVYLALGTDDLARRRRYRALVQSGLNEDTLNKIRYAINSNTVLGDS